MNEKITVLVADDNSDFTMTLSNYLEKEEQIQIVGIARDGNEAYDMAVNLKPDILLLDIIMPHLDGLGVLEKLGEFQYYCQKNDIKIVSVEYEENITCKIQVTTAQKEKIVNETIKKQYNISNIEVTKEIYITNNN